jgi:hypothetical protein
MTIFAAATDDAKFQTELFDVQRQTARAHCVGLRGDLSVKLRDRCDDKLALCVVDPGAGCFRLPPSTTCTCKHGYHEVIVTKAGFGFGRSDAQARHSMHRQDKRKEAARWMNVKVNGKQWFGLVMRGLLL